MVSAKLDEVFWGILQPPEMWRHQTRSSYANKYKDILGTFARHEAKMK